MNAHYKIKRFCCLLGIAAVFVFLFLAPLHVARADNIIETVFGAVGDVLSDAIKSLIETAVFGIMGAFKSLLVLFLQFMGGILDWVMSPDFNNGIIRQPFVQQGWAIVRDFANMFFVVILVIIAIATILRQENFGIRRTLPTLIIIALLVNFSLVLVGFVVDVSQIFMIYFLGAFDDKDFSTVLVNATSFDKLFSDTSINWTEQMSDWEELGVRFVLKAMELLALTFAIAVVALLAVLFVIRTVILWVVAILAPLAFVSYILPASRGLWNAWLKQLTNWALFGPASVFFLFLAGKLMENMSSGPMSSFGQGATALSFKGGGSEFMGHGAPFIQAAAIFTFIFLAINSAKMFTGDVGKMVANKIEGWRRGAVSGAVGFATKPARKRITRARRRMGQRVRRRLERIPVVGAAIGGRGKVKGERRKEVQEKAGEYRNRDTSDVRAMLNEPLREPEDRAALFQVLAERRKLTNEDRKRFRKAAEEGADVEAALKVRPDWAEDVGGSKTETMAKMRPGDMPWIHPEAYKDPEIQRELAKLSPEHVAAVARTISRDEIDGFQAALDSQADEIEKTNPQLYKWLSSAFGRRLGLKTPIKGREHEAVLEEYGKFLDEKEELLAEESVKNLYERLQKDVTDALREFAGEPPEGLEPKTLLPNNIRADEGLTNEWLEAYNKVVREKRINYTRGDEKGKWIEETLRTMGYETSAKEDERTDSRIVTIESAPGPGRIHRRPPGGEPEEEPPSGPGGGPPPPPTPPRGGPPPPPPPSGGTPPPAAGGTPPPTPTPPPPPPGGGGGAAGGAQRPQQGRNIPPVAGGAPQSGEKKTLIEPKFTTPTEQGDFYDSRRDSGGIMRGAPLNGFTLFMSGGARKAGTGDQIIIDGDKDAILQNELSWADGLRNLPEDEKGLLIAQRVRNLLGHPQSEEIVSGLEQEGERLLIGDLAQRHKAGVCRHRALLFHTLAKEAGLDSAMINGMMSDRGTDVGHTWNEVTYANGEQVVVDTAMPPYPTFQYLNPEAFRRSGGFPKVGGTKQGRQYYFGRPEGGKIGVQYTT